MKSSKSTVINKIIKQRVLFLMTFPFLVYVFVFSYLPIVGWIMAFYDYKPGKNIFKSNFIGFKYFNELFSSNGFYLALRNTLVISLLNLALGTFCTVSFAILLNEIKNMLFKRFVQTVSYLPHFVSWVVVVGIFNGILSIDKGLINQIMLNFKLISEPVPFLLKGKWFWWIVTFMNIWKETGWGAIIYLAVMTSISPELYEAATADGAGRFRRIWHITLPGIRKTIVLLLVLSTGWLLGVGFEQSLLMGNGAIIEYSDVLSTYVMRYGIEMGRFSFATAAGIFLSVVGFILVLSSNMLAKKVSNIHIF